MTNEKRNLLIVQLVGIAFVFGVVYVCAKTPEIQAYPLAQTLIPTIIASVLAALGFAGNKDAITEKLRSMAPEKREAIFRASMPPLAPLEAKPVVITFKGADEHSDGDKAK